MPEKASNAELVEESSSGLLPGYRHVSRSGEPYEKAQAQRIPAQSSPLPLADHSEPIEIEEEIEGRVLILSLYNRYKSHFNIPENSSGTDLKDLKKVLIKFAEHILAYVMRCKVRFQNNVLKSKDYCKNI